jgi:hypothetical protein
MDFGGQTPTIIVLKEGSFVSPPPHRLSQMRRVGGTRG